MAKVERIPSPPSDLGSRLDALETKVNNIEGDPPSRLNKISGWLSLIALVFALPVGWRQFKDTLFPRPNTDMMPGDLLVKYSADRGNLLLTINMRADNQGNVEDRLRFNGATFEAQGSGGSLSASNTLLRPTIIVLAKAGEASPFIAEASFLAKPEYLNPGMKIFQLSFQGKSKNPTVRLCFPLDAADLPMVKAPNGLQTSLSPTCQGIP
jgi:hypothetical protein